MIQTEVTRQPTRVLEGKEITRILDGKKVLDSLSFSIPKKGVHGILGPRGAGKTTLMDLLAGCEEADAGAILLNGELFGISELKKKNNIGYVPENPAFYSNMTVLEVMDFVGGARGVATDLRYRQIKEAIELSGLEAVQNRLTRRLSVEESKRLSIALALLGNPEILLLDEPGFGKDSEKRRELFGIIRMLGKHKTVVLASADFATVRELCEDVLILSDGKILAQDTFENLENKLLHNRVLRLQTRGEPQSLISAVSALSGVVSCIADRLKTGEIRLRIEHRADQDIREAVSLALRENGAPILSMLTEHLSLEGIYQSLTAVSRKPRLAETQSEKEGDA